MADREQVEAEVAKAARERRGTFREIAAARGLTPGQVSGIVFRARHGIVRRVRRAQAVRQRGIEPGTWQRAVLVLLADGRERTTGEIARGVGYAHSANAWRALQGLAAQGLVRCVTVGRAGWPSIWRWAEDEDDSAGGAP